MHKKTLNSFTIMTTGIFLMIVSIYQYPQFADFNMISHMVLIITTFYLYIPKYTPAELTKNRDNSILDLYGLLNYGKDELRAYFLSPIITFSVISDCYKLEKKLISKDYFGTIITLDIFISTASYCLLIYLLKKGLESDIEKKPISKNALSSGINPFFQALYKS